MWTDIRLGQLSIYLYSHTINNSNIKWLNDCNDFGCVIGTESLRRETTCKMFSMWTDRVIYLMNIRDEILTQSPITSIYSYPSSLEIIAQCISAEIIQIFTKVAAV